MASSQPILHCRYGYDPLDRLINQFLAGVPEHQRFYCKSRLSTEIQGAIGYSIFQKEDLLLAQQKRQHDAVESTLLATDLQRSVLQTLDAKLMHPIAYSPYGHRRTESGLSSLLGFNGERPDPMTGHYLLGNGYRSFNPVLMRFNSPDSWSPFGQGGLNPYAYCLGDPINQSDANGHFNIPHMFNKLATQILTRLNRTKIKSGTTVTRETISTTTTTTTTTQKTTKFYSKNLWYETTYSIDQSDLPTVTKEVSSHRATTTVIAAGQPMRKYKQNASLKELSYSHIPGSTLKNLPRSLQLETSSEIDFLNFSNAVHERLFNAPRLQRYYSVIRNEREVIIQSTLRNAENGNLMGVHPERVSDIRQKPLFSF